MTNEILTENSALKSVEKSLLEMPALHELTAEQLSEISKFVLLQTYTQELKRDVELLKFNYSDLKNSFLQTVSCSINTKQAYSNALSNFELYITGCKIENILNINNSIADNFIFHLRNSGKSASTVRQYVGGVSSFFSYAERATDGVVKNCFRGTKARPKAKTNNSGKFYNICVNENTLREVDEDIEKIISNVENKELKAIIRIMKVCGLRVGAFNENFQIKGSKFRCITKGDEFIGTLDADCLKAIRQAGLKHTNVFENWTDNKIKCLFKYYTRTLYKKGVIHYAYSCHDLRHFFAISTYNKTKDIYSLSKSLNHHNLTITQTYLRGLNISV